VLVIDDGSTDGTVEVAQSMRGSCVCQPTRALQKHLWLEACLNAGAILSSTLDADNQYCAEDIPKLIKPILLGRAEIVIGARPIWAIEHFPKQKLLQGSWVVRFASNTNIPDAPVALRHQSQCGDADECI